MLQILSPCLPVGSFNTCREEMVPGATMSRFDYAQYQPSPVNPKQEGAAQTPVATGTPRGSCDAVLRQERTRHGLLLLHHMVGMMLPGSWDVPMSEKKPNWGSHDRPPHVSVPCPHDRSRLNLIPPRAGSGQPKTGFAVISKSNADEVSLSRLHKGRGIVGGSVGGRF